MTLAQTIAQCKRELRQDPASLRFVPLAEALRKLGRFREAEEALADGLLSHPGLNSARLVLARVYADTNRRAEALTILDELYPKDSGNVALVSLYLEMLVESGRSDEARLLLERAEIIGVPGPTRERVRRRIEADLWAEQQAQAAVVTPLSAAEEFRMGFGELVSLPATSLTDLGDLFAVPAVAERLERSGRHQAALRVWEELSLTRPDHPGLSRRISALRLGAEGAGVTVQPDALTPLSRPRPSDAGVAALRRFARAAAAACPG